MRVKAPELSKASDWLNVSQPLTLDMLKGKIVVLDFWTFCCVDCMHILPYLKHLEEKFSDVLVVIGVHSAKFPNEKDSTQIRQAIARYHIEHPVANDSRFAVWEDYWVREWPTLVLIDPEGYICKQIPCSKRPHGQLDADISALIETFEAEGKLSRAPLPFTWGPGSEPAGKTIENKSFLSYPGKITNDGTNLYISDTGNNRIVVCDLQGQVQHVIGNGTGGRQDGSYEQASFNSPQGLALNGQILFVADTENHLLRQVDLKECQVTTVAGTSKQALLSGAALQGGAALETDLSSPWDLVWQDDRLYICMAGPHQIWYYCPATQRVGVFAGNAVESLKDGPLDQANLAQPSGITSDGKTLYFADAETSSIRHIDTSAAAPLVSTLVGKGLFEFGDIDGDLSKARLQHPLDVQALNGRLYIADSYNHKIKCLDLTSAQLSTVAGSNTAGFDDGHSARFAEPGGLTAIDSRLYVADTNNHAVRVVDPLSGDTQTLQLQPQPVSSYRDLRLPNVQHLNANPITVAAGEPIVITIDAVLPKHCHLNNEAPQVVQARSNLFAAAERIGESESIVVKTGPVKSGDGWLEVMLQVYYCGEGDDSACRVASFVWQCPVKGIAAPARDKTDNDLHLHGRVALPESAGTA